MKSEAHHNARQRPIDAVKTGSQVRCRHCNQTGCIRRRVPPITPLSYTLTSRTRRKRARGARRGCPG